MIIVINVRIEIMLYSRKLFKISFFIIMGKIFKPLLNLSQIYGPKNGMLFCSKFFSKVSWANFFSKVSSKPNVI